MTSPHAAFDDHVLVHCPKCDEAATIDARSGAVRVTCTACGYVKEVQPRSAALRLIPLSALTVYNSGNTILGARLWLETECCGGHRLWALNERHLDYLHAFVRSNDRTGEFPSPPGNRQLADKLPAWMVEAKHRGEVLRALDRLRTTL